jgi:hypothetical protein
MHYRKSFKILSFLADYDVGGHTNTLINIYVIFSDYKANIFNYQLFNK